MNADRDNKVADDRVLLNVGGVVYATRRSTVVHQSRYLASLLGHHGAFAGSEADTKGEFFIDRDASLFEWVLKFLRNGTLSPVVALHEEWSEEHLRELLAEADFFGIADLSRELDGAIRWRQYRFVEPLQDPRFQASLAMSIDHRTMHFRADRDDLDQQQLAWTVNLPIVGMMPVATARLALGGSDDDVKARSAVVSAVSIRLHRPSPAVMIGFSVPDASLTPELFRHKGRFLDLVDGCLHSRPLSSDSTAEAAAAAAASDVEDSVARDLMLGEVCTVVYDAEQRTIDYFINRTWLGPQLAFRNVPKDCVCPYVLLQGIGHEMVSLVDPARVFA